MQRQYPKFATIRSIATAQCRELGLASIDDLLGDVLPRELVDNYLGERASGVAQRLFGDAGMGKSLLAQHSHFRLFGRLLYKEVEKKVAEALAEGRETRYDNIVSRVRRNGGIEVAHSRWCRDCVRSDVKRYGLAHWRVFHQWPGITCCVDHGVPLSSTAGLPGSRGYGLAADDLLLPSDECISGQPCNARDDRDETPVEEELRDILYALFFKNGFDADVCRPAERACWLANARLLWYELEEEGRLLERMADAWDCDSADGVARKLECSYRNDQSGDNLGEERCLAPIMILAGLATAKAFSESYSLTHFSRPGHSRALQTLGVAIRSRHRG